ncbi:MAG: cation:proton antiporter [Thermoplasmata archaeon]
MEHFLWAVVLILLLGRTLGLITKRLGVHNMLGEVLAGLILGPIALFVTMRLFGVSYGILPDQSLEVLSQFGILMLMILSGLVTDVHSFRAHTVDSIVVGIGGVIASFSLIFLALFFFFPSMSLAAILFISAILSNTAIETCSWMLKESKSGGFKALVIGASFVDDVVTVFILGIVSALVFRGEAPAMSELIILSVKVGLFVGLVLIFGDKVFGLISKYLPPTDEKIVLTAILIMAFILAVIARLVGLHEVIGAYMGGLVVAKWYSNPDPLLRKSVQCQNILRDIEPALLAIFGPLFFVYVGIKLPFSSASMTLSVMGFILLLFVLAMAGKIIGCGATARLRGQPPRAAALVGVSMCGRGALELVLLNYGLDAEVITEAQFFALVVVTLLTIVTTPILYSTLIKNAPGMD